MVQRNNENSVLKNTDLILQSPNDEVENVKPTYALEHLATFKVRNEAEIRNPKEKLKLLSELDKSGAIWPQKMYMSFNGPWLVMLDSELREIENFPGSLIKEPSAFISEDPMEAFNNILLFTVPGVSLGNTEMHIFQVTNISAVYMVEDLKQLSNGKIITIDRNKIIAQLPQPENRQQTARDQYGIAAQAAGVAAEKNAIERLQQERDIQVLNHCFEDIERFVTRLQYAAEALHELESRQSAHNPHGEGLLLMRSRPPTEREFQDIFAKIKLTLNYIVKLSYKFNNPTDPVHNIFVSLQTVVNICHDIYIGVNLPENVVNPLLKRETITFLNASLNVHETEFWYSLGQNWTLPKDQFIDHKGTFHPIFYDDWSPDWVVDEDVAYLPPTIKTLPSSSESPSSNSTWLTRLQSRNVKIAEVTYSKIANNDKELNVDKGEYLEVIDDSRKWWKVRNSIGNIGYIPHTIVVPYNFEHQRTYSARDTDSINSSVFEHDIAHSNNNNIYRNAFTTYVPPNERESQIQQPQMANASAKSMPRSYSMPNVPVPPPMPPPSDSVSTTPSGTLKRNMAAAGTMAAMRARNDCETDDDAFNLQSTINDELKYTLLQRERRRDLEILKTPEIYINQKSKPKEVEEWLRGKGFSDLIVKKLSTLSGEEIFALTPHVFESYFGQKESRRLISQILLQKNICEYKTIRSSELSAKLAKARQKADTNYDANEIF